MNRYLSSRFVLTLASLCAAALGACRSNALTQGSPSGVATTHQPPNVRAATTSPDVDTIAGAESPRERFLSDGQIVFPERASPKPIPFILFLHGFGSSGADLKQALFLSRVAEQYAFAYAAPSGPMDSRGRRFWNADGCCDFERASVDHEGALIELLRRAASEPRIDRARIYAYGFSNGGFMAHQLACAPSTPLAGIVSVAGAPPKPNHSCQPEKPLSIVQVHGDADTVVPFSGGYLLREPSYPRVEAIASGLDRWATALGCSDRRSAKSTSLDLLPQAPGAETTRLAWSGCRGSLGLFLVKGGTHVGVTALPIQLAALMMMMGDNAGHDVGAPGVTIR
jgi:polyhydroxybutyrate depolymerase